MGNDVTAQFIARPVMGTSLREMGLRVRERSIQVHVAFGMVPDLLLQVTILALFGLKTIMDEC